jgi:hypothetical protein
MPKPLISDHCPRVDGLKYIRDYYNVDARRGVVVFYKERSGVITGNSGPHILVKLAGDKFAKPYHPNDLVWSGTNASGKADPTVLFCWIAIALATFTIYRAGYQFVRDRAAFWERNIAAAVAGER